MNKKIFTNTGILFIVLSIILCGCSSYSNSSTEASPSSKVSKETQQNEVFASLVGIYKYDNELDSENFKEDHYIILELDNGNLAGRYYGTSDDFDEVREGYYPGFFVSDMLNIDINNSKISFSIQLKEKDMFSIPIDLEYKSSQDVSIDKNPQWVNSHLVNESLSIAYKGKIVDGQIVIDKEDGQRSFTKIK